MPAVVMNKTSEPCYILEIQKVIPADGNKYLLPIELYRKYQDKLLLVYTDSGDDIIQRKKELDNEKENLNKQIIRLNKEREEFIKEKIKFNEEDSKKIENKKLLEEINLNKASLEQNKLELQFILNEFNNEIINIKEHFIKEYYIKNKSDNLEILFPFHFNDDDFLPAIERLKISLLSLKNQDAKICISNTSKLCIKKYLTNLKIDKYIHKEFKTNIYNKSLTINFGVKQLIRTPYFVLSDIDLIYPENYIQILKNYIKKEQNIRIIPYVCNAKETFLYNTSKSFHENLEIVKNQLDTNRTAIGFAAGNGLIHLATFYLIRGFEESYFGYGPEDADFNKKIAILNKTISDENLKLIHLYHSFNKWKNGEQYLKNEKYSKEYDIILKNINIYDKENKFVYLPYIQSNKNRTWGIIE